MTINETPIPGVVVVETTVREDHRGAFYRAYCDAELDVLLGKRRIRQVNVSRSSHVGAIRGMHFQRSPFAEMKLIRCMKGRVWDVAVDLRKASQTYLKWYAQELSAVNSLMLVVPEGCAHGFQVLEPDSELLYLHTAPYNHEAEGGVRYDDPAISVEWPLPITDVSSRDSSHTLIDENFGGIDL